MASFGVPLEERAQIILAIIANQELTIGELFEKIPCNQWGTPKWSWHTTCNTLDHLKKLGKVEIQEQEPTEPQGRYPRDPVAYYQVSRQVKDEVARLEQIFHSD